MLFPPAGIFTQQAGDCMHPVVNKGMLLNLLIFKNTVPFFCLHSFYCLTRSYIDLRSTQKWSGTSFYSASYFLENFFSFLVFKKREWNTTDLRFSYDSYLKLKINLGQRKFTDIFFLQTRFNILPKPRLFSCHRHERTNYGENSDLSSWEHMKQIIKILITICS